MARFVKGDVVVPFPFSDLTQAKRRPSSVVAVLSGDDLILCQITSRAVTDEYAVVIESDDFSSGGLRQSSNVRPNRLFTADKQIILYKAGQLKLEKMNEVITRIVEILQQCVVIRLLTQDDELQFNKSVEIFRKHDVFIPDTVILETEWVLRFAYKFKPTDICKGLRNLFGLPNVHVGKASLIGQVIQWHESGLDAS